MKITVISVLSFILLSGIQSAQKNPEEYFDLIDLKHTPRSARDPVIRVLADHGSWAGYGLSGKNNPCNGFTGPYLSTTGKYLSPCFASLFIRPHPGTKKISRKQFMFCENTFAPGVLRQRLTMGSMDVVQELYFKDEKTAEIRVSLRNTGKHARSFSVGWESRFFPGVSLQPDHNGIRIRIRSKNPRNDFQITFPPQFSVRINGKNRCYEAESDPIRIEQGEGITFHLRAIFPAADGPVPSHSVPMTDASQIPLKVKIGKIVGQLAPGYRSLPYRQLTVKALLTLTINWKEALGDLKHAGLFPSMFTGYFNGFWAWDSWKHAAALALFDPQLAVQQILAMFDYQDKDGMIADCIYLDKKENNWRNTKPPLAAWALFRIYQKTRDPSLLTDLFPRLLRYHQWWYRFRDVDGDGLCEYGSTDGTRIAAAWESGMDNAVRFDGARMVQSSAHSFSLDRESVDLNSFLYREKVILAAMAKELNQLKLRQQLLDDAEKLRKRINRTMYDPVSGFYYDIHHRSHEQIKIPGPEGFIPLWAGVPTAGQAEEVVRFLCDEKKFNTFLPFPTLSRDHPEFNPEKGYWRGPVWLDGAYFAIRGMKNYGYRRKAREFSRKLLKNAQGLLQKGFPIHENYHPLTGAALNAPNFSWSAAHILLLLTGS